jgi:hypothetical protein
MDQGGANVFSAFREMLFAEQSAIVLTTIVATQAMCREQCR